MRGIRKNFKAKAFFVWIITICLLLSMPMFTATAFSKIRYAEPEEERLERILSRPNKRAVDTAKALQSFTFKRGKTVLAGCLVCHSDKYLTTFEGGKRLSLYVDPEKFSKSVHSEVGCVGCHVGWGLQAHKPPMTDNWRDVAKMACKNCHDYQFVKFSKSLHFKRLTESKKSEGGGLEASSSGEDKLGEGAKRPPTCFDCHGNHEIVKVSAKNSPVSPRNAPEEVCGKCHEHQLETYLENYHGKTLVVLDDDRTPSCFECHSNHNIKNLKNKDDAVSACRGCHKNATAAFVGSFEIHADENSFEHYPVLFVVKWAMIGLLAGVFLFFYPHTALWLIRKLKENNKHGH
ncbi:MAG: multiheme c-type cytochrome [Actinomycetota bacterium]|nr:multiheme c-type cytochrome [Actinomycetota bacterium]